MKDIIRDIWRELGEDPADHEQPPRGPSPPRQTRAGGSAFRWWLATALVIVLAGGAVAGYLVLRDDPGAGSSAASVTSTADDQDVVAWAVSESADEAFVGVLAAGGGRRPVALLVPGYTVVSIPGYGLATVGDAAALEDPALGTAAMENLLGVRVDAWKATSFEGLSALVDELGGITVGSDRMSGQDVMEYLGKGGRERRFIRWRDIVTGLLPSVALHPDGLAGVPDGIGAVMVPAARKGADLVELPVEAIGSGLVRPDTEAISSLVGRLFVTESRRRVRLVVLNGNGTPGVGERVSRLLGPSGFRLVSTQNAPTFDEERTRIVASDPEFLNAARQVRRRLGAGRVFLSAHPTGVADVTVVVGQDFGGP